MENQTSILERKLLKTLGYIRRMEKDHVVALNILMSNQDVIEAELKSARKYSILLTVIIAIVAVTPYVVNL